MQPLSLNCPRLSSLFVFLSLLQKGSSQTVTIIAKQVTCKYRIPVLTSPSDLMLMLLEASTSTSQHLKVKISKLDITFHFLFMVPLSSPSSKLLEAAVMLQCPGQSSNPFLHQLSQDLVPSFPFSLFSLNYHLCGCLQQPLIVLSWERPRRILIKPFLGQHLKG